MEEKILQRIAVFVTTVSIFTCVIIFYFPQLHQQSQQMITAMKEKKTKSQAEDLKMTGLEILEYNNTQVGEEVSFQGQLRLALPLGVTGEVIDITEDYVTQTVSISIPYADEDYLFSYPMLGKSDHIDSLTYESKSGTGVVEIITDRVFELKTSYDDDYLYLDFLEPREVYDKIVVIDAGHGGDATGATKQGINEKDIDLAIVLKLKEIFENTADESLGVYYTRTDDSNPSFEDRVGLANKLDADMLISIHNNATPSGRMSNINGTQVMYDEARENDELGGKGLAQICLEEVTGAIGSSNKGLVAGNEIYIIRSSEVPAALIEVGFMTNQTELNNLRTEEYQIRAAQGIYNAVIRAFNEGY